MDQDLSFGKTNTDIHGVPFNSNSFRVSFFFRAGLIMDPSFKIFLRVTDDTAEQEEEKNNNFHLYKLNKKTGQIARSKLRFYRNY